MGDNEVERYLEHLVLKQNVAPRTQATDSIHCHFYTNI